jgi:hypothetical protein
LWDGYDIFWQFTGWSDWLPLTSAAQFPDFAKHFDETVPAALKGCAPPFLTTLPEPGTLQIWTGLLARTAIDWSLLIRAPANLPLAGGYCMYEGIVEADRWFGPLFINLRFTRTHQPVRLKADFPLAQVQPLPRVAYADGTLVATWMVTDLTKLKPSDWSDYLATIATPNESPDRNFGAYATAVRKRSRASSQILPEEVVSERC